MVKKSDLYKVDGDKIERKNPILVVVKVYSWLTMVTGLHVVNVDTLK